MDRIVVQGGAPLKGRVKVSGSKNASLPLMAACLLAEGGECRVENVPEVRDLQTMRQMLEVLGAKASLTRNLLTVDPAGFAPRPAPYELVRTMRASIYVLGPLLARFGEARVALPGGCAIGLRPVDQHLKGFRALGAEVSVEHGYIQAKAPHGLTGAEIYLDVASVGATVNLLLAAALARGRTVIENAACEPEIINLSEGLNAMGARVQGAGTSRLVVEGVPRLQALRHRAYPDRIEAGTLAIAVAMTRGDAVLEGYPRDQLAALELKLNEAGVEVTPAGTNAVRVRRRGPDLAPADITTLPYPGFPTDLQAQWTAMMCLASGRSVVTETIWENRFMHVAELNRMGADIQIESNRALVRGATPLSGAPVMASDLRASAALVLAGLVAEGETVIRRIYHLDRGYERIEAKLTTLGATLRREAE
jgi:UDP-N-acetylglucosamine 1-carboxyvinyltransferase